MVNAGEKFPDVTLQNPAGAGIVSAGFIGEFPKTVEGFMRSFAEPAGIRISDERSVKIGIQNPIYGMVYQPVTDAGFMNIARLWVADIEGFIPSVAVISACQIIMKRDKIVYEAEFKFLDVALASFALDKLVPGRKQII